MLVHILSASCHYKSCMKCVAPKKRRRNDEKNIRTYNGACHVFPSDFAKSRILQPWKCLTYGKESGGLADLLDSCRLATPLRQKIKPSTGRLVCKRQKMDNNMRCFKNCDLQKSFKQYFCFRLPYHSTKKRKNVIDQAKRICQTNLFIAQKC